MPEIHPTAIVSPNAQLAPDVRIGAYCIIYDRVIIHDHVTIENFCELGLENAYTDDSPLVIGRNSWIRSHSTFYANSEFGDGLITGHKVTIREKTKAGKGFQLGTLGDIQGHCEIGDYVKCHSNVHIGQHSKLDNFIWIFPYVVLTNDPHPPSEIRLGCHIHDFAVIATMSVVLPGVHVHSDTLVAAGSIVNRDVPSGWVVGGNPAKPLFEISKIRMKDGSGLSAYPWRRHFHRGYPSEEVEKWLTEFSTSPES